MGVYQAVDLLPEIAVSQVPEAKQALAALTLIPDSPDLQLILAFTGPAYPREAESQFAAPLQNQPPSHPLAGDQPRQHAPVA